jgi:hypothetical protein
MVVFFCKGKHKNRFFLFFLFFFHTLDSSQKQKTVKDKMNDLGQLSGTCTQIKLQKNVTNNNKYSLVHLKKTFSGNWMSVTGSKEILMRSDLI